ncbi:unnamed protein product [Angiostrongylus costaricensis]|uniref:SH2 domain-containing protein n=1 Tax=Angiostrongylus costaricensis TaxID=334426 RepID=A0A158PHZ6_ANGCS|nr:unnamed protein product [Angiostrongylus costaricensis]
MTTYCLFNVFSQLTLGYSHFQLDDNGTASPGYAITTGKTVALPEVDDDLDANSKNRIKRDLSTFIRRSEEGMVDQLIGRGRAGSDEVHWSYSEHVGPSIRREFAENPEFSQCGVTNGNDWLHPLSDVVYEDLYQFQDLRKIGKPLDHIEETCFPPDRETYIKSERDLLESLQVAANEVVIDEISNTGEYQQYVASVHRHSPQQYVRSNPDHLSQTGSPHQTETVPDTNRELRTVQNASSTLEMGRIHPLQYEVGAMNIFKGPFNQSEGAPPPHHVPISLSTSKSQPRHPLCGKLDDESLDPVQDDHFVHVITTTSQEHNEGKRRRVRKKQLVDNMFANRGQAALQCEPSIDPATGRYVVQLDDLRGLHHANTKCQRYVKQPTIQSFRKMADSARRVGGACNWRGAGRQQKARVSKIEQAPRFTTNSTPGSSSSSQRHLPSDLDQYNYSRNVQQRLGSSVVTTQKPLKSSALEMNMVGYADLKDRRNPVKPRERPAKRMFHDRDSSVATWKCTQKAGRPPKKLRGRLAKPKQAIRDAARAQKLATKGSLQSLFDSSFIHNAALLHEVGEVLIQPVTQIFLYSQKELRRNTETKEYATTTALDNNMSTIVV